MRWQRITIWFILFLGGFAFTLLQASRSHDHSSGGVWLILSFILAIGLIGTALAAIADFHAAFSQDSQQSGHRSRTNAGPPIPAPVPPRNAAHPSQQPARDPDPEGR